MLLLALSLSLFVFTGTVVGTFDLDHVAEIEQARVDARSDALLEVLPRLAFGAVGPLRARAGIIGREQGGALRVVADAHDLVEDALLEFALPALADLVDGEDFDLA